MDSKIIAGVVALIIAAISLILLVPEPPKQSSETLPWNIQHPTAETTKIFGLTLNKSTLLDAENLFKDTPKISMFKPSDEDKFAVEVFFEEVNFNGLRAQIDLILDIPEAQLQEMYQRGERMSSTASGKRITLTLEDASLAGQAPIRGLTYLPATRLDNELIERRFGKPSEKIRENAEEITHWLYPQHGLDIALSENGKAVLQFVPPPEFEDLRAPLLKHGTPLQ